ncbi:MAG: sulfotransferase [Pseudomonadota bacterium]|nr:sulfotransferase [Pseudomonadota bacterium]
MQLSAEFYRLPLRFDAERLREEVESMDETDWRPHPQGFAGNSALILVSRDGEINDDMSGPMAPTPLLERCPYLKQVMASFNTVIGRSRLMRIEAGEQVNEHTDIHYYWRDRVRVHVPIVTHPSVEFWCAGKQVHMAAGEAWTFDNWRMHTVLNPSSHRRIHLVMDTVGSPEFWDMVEPARQAVRTYTPDETPPALPYIPGWEPSLSLERFNQPPVMHPAEVDLLLQETVADADPVDAQISATPSESSLKQSAARLTRAWRALWAEFGDTRPDIYRRLLEQHKPLLLAAAGHRRARSNGQTLDSVLASRLAAFVSAGRPTIDKARGPRSARARQTVFDRPAFIVAAPRSGSTLLFETLCENRALWSVGGESHRHFESIADFNPLKNGRLSNRLDEDDATAKNVAALSHNLLSDLRHADGTTWSPELAATPRLLEKTPKNALRVAFLAAAFPDARFVFLHRRPQSNLSSIMEAWRSGQFVTYPDLPGWRGPAWSLLLPPGWQHLDPDDLARIAAFQWHSANQQILSDLELIPQDRWTSVSYEALLDGPAVTIELLCDFLEIPFGPRMKQLTAHALPLSRYTVSAPDRDKWRRNEADILRVLPAVADMAARLDALTNATQQNRGS